MDSSAYAFASLIAVFAMLVSGVSGALAGPGSKLYARCAACHLPNGAGVVGIYPPLKDNLPTFLATQQGRDYLAQVVLHGMRGPIKVNGQTYRGAMASVVSGLSAQKISDLLNDLVVRFGSVQQASKQLFSVNDVERNKAGRVKNILALRNAALEKVPD